MSEPEAPGDAPATPPPASSSEPTGDDRNLAVVAHLLGILISFLGPLIIFLIKKDSAYVNNQAKEALNFQITVVLAQIVAGILVPVFGVGCIALPVVMVSNLVFCILAAAAASKGESYRYPIAIRLIN